MANHTVSQSDLFGHPRRKANATPSGDGGVTITFTVEQFAHLHEYRRPDGRRQPGGMQGMVHWLLDHTDRKTLACRLDYEHLGRLLNYLQNYGDGGPNSALRKSCPGPLAAAGIIVKLWGQP